MTDDRTPAPLSEVGARIIADMEARGAANRETRLDRRARLRRILDNDARAVADDHRWRARRAIPAAYADASADHPQVARWVADVIAGRTDDWLLLLGPTGVGKTWQGIGAWRAVIEARGCSNALTTAADYLGGLRPSAPLPLDPVALRRADLLLLDDVTADLTAWGTGELLALVDARRRHRKLTVVTSNLSPRELSAGLGERLASRLVEHVRAVPLIGPDRRRTSPAD